jgi:hypothetical protein
MTTFDLDAEHPSFAKFDDWWIEVDDAIEGESAIELATTDYLPKPGAMLFITDPTKQAAAYAAFQKRASYPEITAPTIRGLTGVIHTEPCKIELPKTLEYLRGNATIDGLTLESMIRRITRNVVGYGRTGIAVTADANGDPILAVYTARSIQNWNDNLTVLVLDESGPELNEETLTWKDAVKKLLFLKQDGAVTAERYTQTDKGWGSDQEDGPVVFKKTGGQNLDFIPFVFIDTNDLTPEPDEVPLLPLVRLAAKAYRQDANYQHTLYQSSSPTHWISGMGKDDPEAPQALGGGIIWYLPDETMKCGILEFTGASAVAQRQAIQDTLEAAVQAGARLFANNDAVQESGEARKIKYAAQTATLVGIALNVVAGVEKALKMAAVIAGANEDEVQVRLNTDFIDSTLGAQEMTAIISAVTAGLLSYETGYEQMREGGRANTERDWEDEKALIEQQEPAMGMEGRGMLNPDQENTDQHQEE